MSESKLSNKQQQWLDYYFICNMNATEAARRAGYAHPNKSGPENLQRPYIKELIEARMKEVTMSADEVLMRLAQHARGSMEDFVDINDEVTSLSLQRAFENGYAHLIKKITIADTKEGQRVTLELYDAQAALVHIGRKHKLFTDKHEHGLDAATRKLLTREDLQELTDEQLAAIATGLATSGSE